MGAEAWRKCILYNANDCHLGDALANGRKPLLLTEKRIQFKVSKKGHEILLEDLMSFLDRKKKRKKNKETSDIFPQ